MTQQPGYVGVRRFVAGSVSRREQLSRREISQEFVDTPKLIFAQATEFDSDSSCIAMTHDAINFYAMNGTKRDVNRRIHRHLRSRQK